MKKYCLLCVTSLLAMLICTEGRCQTEKKDQITNAVKLKELTLKKEKLEAQITEEDKKRNKQVNGVSYDVQEQMNDQQDFVCLELRSKLVSIEMEIKELQPDNISPAVANQYNKLVQQAKSEEKK